MRVRRPAQRGVVRVPSGAGERSYARCLQVCSSAGRGRPTDATPAPVSLPAPGADEFNPELALPEATMKELQQVCPARSAAATLAAALQVPAKPAPRIPPSLQPP